MPNAPTQQDYGTRLRLLSEKREEAVTRHARLKAIKEQAERQLIQLRQEMEALGTTPETLDQDVANAEETLAQSIQQSEEAMTELDRQITLAEQTLEHANPLNQ